MIHYLQFYVVSKDTTDFSPPTWQGTAASIDDDVHQPAATQTVYMTEMLE